MMRNYRISIMAKSGCTARQQRDSMFPLEKPHYEAVLYGAAGDGSELAQQLKPVLDPAAR